jgi:PAS domain S-box-containing protein
MGSSTLSPAAVLEVVDDLGPPGTPLTTPEVAERFDCTTRTIYNKLDALAGEGLLETKKVGARGRVWWRPADGGSGSPDDASPATLEAAVDDACDRDVAVYTLDADCRLTYLNDRAETWFGVERATATGEHVWAVFDRADAVDDAFRTALDVGEPSRYTIRCGSSGRWFEGRVFPADGGLAVYAADVTERKAPAVELRERATRDAFRVDLVDALRPLADPTAIQRAAARVLGEHLDVERAYYAEVFDDEDTNLIHADYCGAGVRSIAGKHRLRDYGAFVAEAFRAGETVVTPDCSALADLSESERDAYRRIEVASWMGVPLVKNGRLIAYVAVTQSTPRAWTATEVAMVEETAERTWDAVERARAEDALHTSENRTRLAAEAAGIGVWELDVRTGEALVRSPRHDEIFGYDEPVDDWSLERTIDHVHPDDRERVERRLEAATDDGTWAFESRIVRADGEHRWIAARGEISTDERGEPTRGVGVVRDVTERTLRERQLDEQRAELEQREEELATELGEVYGRISDAVYAVDEAWQITHVNDRTEELVGRSSAELLGEELRNVFPGTADTAASEVFYEAMETGDPRGHVRYSERLGTWVEETVYPSETGLSVYFRDVAERVETQRKLRESERRYRTVLDSMDEGFLLMDLVFDDGGRPIDALYRTSNPAATRLLGESYDGRWLSEIGPPSEDYWYEVAGRVAATGEDERVELHSADGEHWYDLYAFKPEGAETRRVAAFFQDITDRKRTEVELERRARLDAFRVDLVDALRPLADPEEIQRAAAHVLGGELDVDRAHYVEVDPDGETLLVRADYYPGDAPSAVGEHRFRDYGEYAPNVLLDGEKLVVDDSTALPGLTEAERAVFRATEARAHVSVPLVKDDRLTAFFTVLQSTPRAWTATEVAMVEETAERTWDAVERARAEGSLRQSQERLRSLANLVPSLLWSTDETGSRFWYNQQWYDYTGQTPEEAADYGWLDAIHPDDRERSRRQFQDAVDAGEPLRQEHRVRRHDGEYRPFLVRARPVRDDDGSVRRWFGAATDVHDEREVTAALERLNAVTRELIDADETTLRERATDLALDVLDVEYTGLWRYGERGELELDASSATEAVDADPAQSPEAVWRTFVGEELDVAADLDVPDDGAAHPLRSRLLVPLGRHGVVCAGSTRAGAFDERTVDLAETLATAVESAWDRAEGERELAEQRDELERLDGLNTLIRRIDQALVDAETVDEIREAVCERLAASDRFAFTWIGDYDGGTGSVEPREWAGVDGGYLETLRSTVDDESCPPDPVLAAVRTGEVRVVADVATDPRTAPWREATLRRGARSCLCIPLVYEESVYGVLSTYGTAPRPDERDADVLAELGRTIAHAINAVEAKATLRTDDVVELTLRTTAATTPLCQFARSLDGELVLEGLVQGSHGGRTVYFTATDRPAGEVLAAGEASVAIEELTRLADGEAGALFSARTTDATLASLLVERGAVVRSLTIDRGDAVAVVELSESGDVREFVDEAPTAVATLELLARRTRSRAPETDGTLRRRFEDRLTPRQLDVLHTAYRSGFFRSPRARSAKELSETLDISQSTFARHLREAERKLCGLVLDPW